MPSLNEEHESRPVVVITGASAGVGRAVAVAFARQGWRVALLARGREGLEGARRDVEAAGGTALILPADVADAGAVDRAADAVVAAWGRIDVWVNNAMATVFSRVDDITPDEFRRVTEVTYLGQVHGTLAALRHMRSAKRGTIVQVGSALSYRAIPLQSAYCAAKFAVRGFTDALRCELLHERSPVRLTMVQLPAVNTPQFGWARDHMDRRPQPVGRIAQPEPVAEAIVRAALAAPRELWIGGSTLKSILGSFAVPSWLDGLMARMAWGGQLTGESSPAGRPDNLFAPVPGDPGTHGRFDARAHDSVHALSSAGARGLLAVAAAGLALTAALAGAAWARGTARRRGPALPAFKGGYAGRGERR